MDRIITNLSNQLSRAERGMRAAQRVLDCTPENRQWIMRRTLNRYLEDMKALTLAIDALRQIRVPVMFGGVLRDGSTT